MSRIREQIFELKKKNENNYISSLTQIVKYAFSKMSNYNKEEWKKSLPVVIDMFYKGFEEVYLTTSKEIRNIYGRVQDFNVSNIFDLTFNTDGKTIEERIGEYWNEVGKKLEQKQIPITNIKEFLIHNYERIIRTETNKIENLVKKNKKPQEAYVLIIESGCDACEGGEFPADEDVALPPYHPNCNCTFYYELIQDENTIEDLELEVEE